jgi:3-phosphoshikimate 1-carboxyvinyltransferase
MNAIGSHIDVQGLSPDSAQPDRRIVPLLAQTGGDKDMSQCPDIFPPLAVAAASVPATTRFTGVRRLRLKESNRLASVADLLTRLGVPTEETDDTFTVRGTSSPFPGGVEIQSYGDHRIAMSAAVAATRAAAPLRLDNPACAAKSYPAFFPTFASLPLL